MALTEKQATWLSGIVKEQVAAEKDGMRRAQKAGVIEDAMRELDSKRDKIRETLQGIKVELEPEGFFETLKAGVTRSNPNRPVLTPDSVATDEWDFSLSKRGMPSEDDQLKMAEIMNIIINLSEKMMSQTDDDGNPLFDPENDADFAKSFYEPLVREGIIPENLVIGKFSEVERTMQGAVALYDKRLKDYSKDLTKTDKFLEMLDLPVEIGTAGLEVASSAMMMKAGIEAFGAGVPNFEALKENGAFEHDSKISEILEGAAACLSGSKKAADSVIKKTDLQGASDVLITAVAKVLLPTQGKDFTKMFTNIATAASHAAPLAVATTQGDMAKMLDLLGKSIADSLTASSGDPGFALAADAIKTQFGALSKIAGSASDNSDAMTKVMQAAAGAGAAAGKEIMSALKDRALEDIGKDPTLSKEKAKEEETRVKDFFGALGKGIGFADKQGEIAMAMPASLKKISDKATESIKKDYVAQLEKEGQAASEKELKLLMTQYDEGFDEALELAFADEERAALAEDRADFEERQIKSLERLLADLQRQQKIVDFAKQIATGGFSSIETLVPGMSTVAAGNKMLVSFGEAVQKSRQVLIWAQNTKDAKKAVTVQYEVMVNEYGLQSEQAIVAGIDFLIKAMALVGDVMKQAGHLAPVGVAISAGASGGQALLDAAHKTVSKAKMDAAWKTYKAALEDPNNRLLAREALRTNPTLAKYALAWGAVEDGNRIAQSALASCGIDEDSLKDPGTDVAKVVKYLEVYFRDDPQLLREVPAPEAWYPGEIELTVQSWMAFHKAAQDKAKTSFKDTESSKAAGRFYELADQLDRLKNAVSVEDKEQQRVETVTAYDNLISVLERYKPKDTKGKPHEEMTIYVRAVLARAQSQRTALAG